MLFNSYDFILLFLPLTLLAFALVNWRAPRWNTAVLLAASIAFYGYWSLTFASLLLASIAANFALGRHVRSRWAFLLGITLNLAVLGYFKYAVFLTSLVIGEEGATNLLGVIILPLGISFYTFQQISYLADMRRGEVIRPDFTTYAAYVALFPQLIAGPIVRYVHVDRQLERILRGIPTHRLTVMISSGLLLFSIGLFKKVVIADSLAQWSDPVFAAAALQTVSTRDAWIGATAYTFQLYFDFSAYSDMALGLGRMFGLILPANFFSPYKSESIAEFWRRWHMSLSYFVRDYIYIPLGGSRKGPNRQAVNLFIAFTLIGIWHGAGFTFLLWGVYHATLVSGSHLFKEYLPRLPRPAAILWTLFLVMLGWVMFRAADVESAIGLYYSMFSITEGRPIFHELGQAEMGMVVIAIAAAVALLAPNAIEIVGSRAHTLLHGLRLPRKIAPRSRRRRLTPIIAGVGLYFGVTSLVGLEADFLYFNF